MRELLTAIGLTALYEAELQMRLRLGAGIVPREGLISSRLPILVSPEDFLRLLRMGVEFSLPPPEAVLPLAGLDRSQHGGGLGRDHRVGGGAQRIYPLRRNPQ